MEVKFAKFWFEDLLSLHARAQGKKTNKKQRTSALCLPWWSWAGRRHRWNVQANTTNYVIKCGVKILPMKFSHLRWLEIVFFETPKDYIQSAQKPTFLLRGQTNFTRINQRFEAWDCGRVMTIAIILVVLISVWERSRKFLDRFSHNSRIFFIEIMPRCRTYFNKLNLSVSKLWRRWFYSWIFSVSTWNYFQKEL